MIKEYIKQLEGVSFNFLLSSLKRLVVGDKKLTNLKLINEFIHKRSAHVTQNTLYGYLQTRIGGNYIKAFKDENYLKSINISRWNIFVVSVQDISLYIFSYLYKNQNYQKFEEAKKIYHKILLSEKKTVYPMIFTITLLRNLTKDLRRLIGQLFATQILLKKVHKH